MKKIVFIFTLCSLGSLSAAQEGEKKFDNAIAYLKEVAHKTQSTIQNIADWADASLQPMDELVKNNPRKALVLTAVTGAILRKTTLVTGASYGLYQLIKKPQKKVEHSSKQVPK